MGRRLVILAMLLLLPGCAGGRTMPHAALHHGIFVSAREGFCLKAPESWELREGVEGLALAALSPVDRGQAFRVNLTVVGRPLKGDETLAGFVDASLAEVEKALPGYKLQDRGGGDRVWVTYQHVYSGQTIQVLAYFATSEGKGYVFAFNAGASEFARQEELFRQIAGTIGFTPEDRQAMQRLLDALRKVDDEKFKLENPH